MDSVTVYMETVYNSPNSTNLTRNINKNRNKNTFQWNANHHKIGLHQIERDVDIFILTLMQP